MESRRGGVVVVGESRHWADMFGIVRESLVD